MNQLTIPSIERYNDVNISPPDEYEWTKEDLQRAKDSLYNAIMNGEVWDEDGDYRFDMLTDFEQVLLDKEDDKLARIKDAHYINVMKYVNDQVRINPDKYCEVDDD